MKFKSTIDTLNELLNRVIPIVPQKSTILVLQYLHVTLQGNELKVMVTNEELSLLTTIEVEGIEDGSVLFPAKKFNEIVKLLSKGSEVTISVDSDNYEVTLNYNKGKFKFKGIEPDEFVDVVYLFKGQIPMIEELSTKIEQGENVALFKKGVLQKVSDRLLFAVSTEEYKPAMTGVLFQFREKQLITAATDGYRLNRYIINDEGIIFSKLFDVIIPAHSLEFLKKIDSDIIMNVIYENEAPKFLRFDYDDTVFVTRIINEKYPPYETIIPEEFEFTAFVPLNELINTMKRVSLSSNNVSKLVVLKFENNQLNANTQNEETGELAEETLPCEMNFSSFEIGVKYDYFLQSLQHLYYEGNNEDIAEIRFNDPVKAFIICPKDQYETLIMLNMPVRYK